MRDPLSRPTQGRRTRTVVGAAILTLAAAAASPAPARAQEPGNPSPARAQSPGSQKPAADGDAYRQLLAERAPAVVSVRFVLHIEFGGEMSGAMGGPGQEVESEASGVVVDPGGLVLCSNTLLGGFASLLPRLAGGGSGIEMSATPTDIEVLIGGAAEGVPARLVARDSDLDLAWLQIEDPVPGGLTAVDLEAGVAARIGEPFVAVRRLDKLFARAPALLEGRIGGEVEKPRRLWVPAATDFGGYGLPVFNAADELLGVTVMQAPDAADLGAGGPIAHLWQSSRLQDVLSAVILPASEVARATALARETVAARENAEEE